MSYLNFSATIAGTGPRAQTTTFDVGYSREGGRLDLLDRRVHATPRFPAELHHVPRTEQVVAAADALKGSLLSMGERATSITFHCPPTAGEVSRISWTYPDGAVHGPVAYELAPAAVRDAADAAARLVDAALTARPAGA